MARTFALVLALVAASAARAFYLPGVAPREYDYEEKVRWRTPRDGGAPSHACRARTRLSAGGAEGEQADLRQGAAAVPLLRGAWRRAPRLARAPRRRPRSATPPSRAPQLPVCTPDTITRDSENLGEILAGDRIENSNYELYMRFNDRCKVRASGRGA
jgi:hypothetical protein